MFTWFAFRVIILILLAVCYLTLSASQRKSGESLDKHCDMHYGSPGVDVDAFARSIKHGMKSDHCWQCGFMVVAAVVLAIFDSHYYIIAAMFCATLAAAHLYFARRMDV